MLQATWNSNPWHSEVILDGQQLKVDLLYDHTVSVDTTLSQAALLTGRDIPDWLRLVVSGLPPLEASLCSSLDVSSCKGHLGLRYLLFGPDGPSEGRWGIKMHLRAAAEAARNAGMKVRLKLDEDPDLQFIAAYSGSTSVATAVQELGNRIKSVLRQAELSLMGFCWKPEYLTDEKSFTTELLLPLLRKMKFIAVRYRHGRKEYGKDITFSELGQFGQLRHYAVQVKAGDVRGGVNSEVDELIAQTRDAFEMPCYEVGTKEPRYIATLLIAISGRFTENAKEKIAEKLPKGILGSVYFLDHELISELIERYWTVHT